MIFNKPLSTNSTIQPYGYHVTVKSNDGSESLEFNNVLIAYMVGSDIRLVSTLHKTNKTLIGFSIVNEYPQSDIAERF